MVPGGEVKFSAERLRPADPAGQHLKTMKSNTIQPKQETVNGTRDKAGSSCADLLSVVSAIPREVRGELTETIEEIGQAMGLLREAIDDADNGNIPGGQMCGSDALEILSSLEAKFSGMAAKIAAWAELEHHEEANYCG